MRYAEFTIKKRGGTLLINKEMWLQDYPPDVNVEWGPMSPKARRQRTVFLIPFLGLMIATVTYLVLDLRSVLGTEPGFSCLRSLQCGRRGHH